jgi:hypothetical protein
LSWFPEIADPRIAFRIHHPAGQLYSTAMKHLLTVLALASIALLGGCATNVNSVSRTDSLASPSIVNDRRVVTDKSLGDTIRIVGVNESTVSGNLKKVQVYLGECQEQHPGDQLQVRMD